MGVKTLVLLTFTVSGILSITASADEYARTDRLPFLLLGVRMTPGEVLTQAEAGGVRGSAVGSDAYTESGITIGVESSSSVLDSDDFSNGVTVTYSGPTDSAGSDETTDSSGDTTTTTGGGETNSGSGVTITTSSDGTVAATSQGGSGDSSTKTTRSLFTLGTLGKDWGLNYKPFRIDFMPSSLESFRVGLDLPVFPAMDFRQSF